MAEFPDLGAHCAFEQCGLLDFLPARCNACNKEFCQTHVAYDQHECESAHLKDIRVPVCPLCSKPVPTGRNENADLKVSEHIDRDCQADPAKKIAYKNRCSVKGCRKKELIPITCPDCRQNFCITHRHTTDHKCPGPPPPQCFSRLAAEARRTQSQKGAKPDTSSDEALARALQLAMNDQEGSRANLSPEELDRRLAMQLQQEENQRRNLVGSVGAAGGSNRNRRSRDNQCCVS
ncbi:hypothetical protein QR680_014031 [Steinernema hermaphroditum]|uniref:AN1-type domain-containing protein n=1 Tax=Steinernema hermaphroditum TaxID=289476 RepID=A0AA39I8W1_9BILA|nr:hypothetical protein QR680_014031 [Steinernema hermaphroditum]